MKRIISFFLLLLLLLPTIAQKPCTIRVVAGKDYPYYITAVGVIINEKVNDGQNYRYESTEINFDKLDNRTYTYSYVPNKNARTDFTLCTLDQQGLRRTNCTPFEIPTISGEQLTVTLHDAWNLEIGGSQLYREYGKAYHAIHQQGEPVKDYIAKHSKERGCALFVLSEKDLPDGSWYDKKTCYELFDSATVSFLGDPNDPATLKDIACFQHIAFVTKMYSYYDRDRKSKLDTFDRQLEGQDIIDAVRSKYKGKPTLLSVWSYGGSDSNAYELIMHAKGMNLVYLTSLKTDERMWKNDIYRFPGDYYLLMRYQVDSLFQYYMPGIEHPTGTARQFFILLDAEGKIVECGDRLHNYRQLIAKTDQLKAEAGLPPFKEKPYELKYLDLDVDGQKNLQTNNIFQQATERMTQGYGTTIRGVNNRIFTMYKPHTTKSKQLKISQRLYNAVLQQIEEKNKKIYELAQSNDDRHKVITNNPENAYQEHLEEYRKDMIVGKPVDLGLSVKWADINVGAKAAEETGMYFTWGDPEPINDTNVGRNWLLYRWCKGIAKTLHKYNTKAENGAVDMRTTVLPGDDAATIYWQGDWRTPSQQEADELKEKCQWEWTEQNGHNGYKVTGPNGNSIFIPAAGCVNFQGLYGAEEHGYYWTSNISPDSPTDAYYLAFTQEGVHSKSLNERCAGRCIRPVCK